jgi:sulfur oxidation c-type cytochrome SoxX
VEAGRSLFAGVPYEGSVAKGGCINCHAFRNSDGDLAGGNIGPELTWSVRNRGREYVKEHIINSRSHAPDSIMPAFKDYNDAELESLVDYLASFDYQLEPMSEAQQLYDTYCVSCHGEDLNGQGRVSAMLDPYPRNFNKYQFVASYEERFKDSILNGVKGTAMPAWRNVLSELQIDRLIQFIQEKSLENAPPNFVRIDVALP